VKARVNTEELFEYRGMARYKLDDVAGAAGDLDKAVTMGAKDADVFLTLGNAKFRLDNYKTQFQLRQGYCPRKKDAIIFNNRGKAN